MKIMSIYDSKAEQFMIPFFSINVALATRQFSDVVNNPETDFCKFAEDFTLFELGSFSEKDGSFELFGAPKSVVTGITLKKECR